MNLKKGKKIMIWNKTKLFLSYFFKAFCRDLSIENEQSFYIHFIFQEYKVNYFNVLKFFHFRSALNVIQWGDGEPSLPSQIWILEFEVFTLQKSQNLKSKFGLNNLTRGRQAHMIARI